MLRAYMFIILGKFFGWCSEHPLIAQHVAGWLFRWSLNFIPDELRGDQRIKAVVVDGMSRKLGEGLDQFLNQGGEVDIDDLMDRFKRLEEWQILTSVMGLTETEFRQLVENELFLAKHRKKHRGLQQ